MQAYHVLMRTHPQATDAVQVGVCTTARSAVGHEFIPDVGSCGLAEGQSCISQPRIHVVWESSCLLPAVVQIPQAKREISGQDVAREI